MINKVVDSIEQAIGDIPDGAVVAIGGLGATGWPHNLVQGLSERKVRELTVISTGARQYVPLLEAGCVTKIISTYPVLGTGGSRGSPLEKMVREKKVTLELLPFGTMVERLRAAGAGIAAFYTPTGVGTAVEKGKEFRTFNGKKYLLEHALKVDFALVKAYRADRLGNLVYRYTARNNNPVMATAAQVSIAEVEEIVEVGQLAGDIIVTPAVFIKRVVKAPRLSSEWFVRTFKGSKAWQPYEKMEKKEP